MDVIKRIDDLMKERNWTYYKLAIESGLSSSTVANMYRRNTVPSIATIEAICNAFQITMAQFFNENTHTVQLTEEQFLFYKEWEVLTAKQKKLLFELIQEMKY